MRAPRRKAVPRARLAVVAAAAGVTSLVAAPGCSRSAAQDSAAPSATGATTTSGDTAATAGTPASDDAAAPSGTAPSGDAPDAGVAWARRLSPLLFRDVNTLADVTLRLYKDDGAIDDAAAAEVERVLWSAKDEAPPHVSRRLLQLVVKVADHFDAHEIQVISSHRGKASKGSRHRSGEAIDFTLPGVPSKKIAEVLRTYPRVGVGEYIHPRSQFVHLDVREQSYHWIDSSPPKRSWREHPLPDVTAAARDAAYAPAQDLPDGAQ